MKIISVIVQIKCRINLIKCRIVFRKTEGVRTNKNGMWRLIIRAALKNELWLRLQKLAEFTGLEARLKA